MSQTLDPTSSPRSATDFGREWAAAWNRGDVEAVLAHFADDCVFESALAEKHAGTSRVVGKEALRAYWTQALAALGSVRFSVELVALAEADKALAIVYRAELGERHVHACERLIFGEDGRVRAGMGLYGPPVLGTGAS